LRPAPRRAPTWWSCLTRLPTSERMAL
jgi:hypothetical protein